MPKTGLIGFKQNPLANRGGLNAQMIGALGVEQPSCAKCGMILGNLAEFDIQSHDAKQGQSGKLGIITYPVTCRSCGAKQTVTVTVAIAVKVELTRSPELTPGQQKIIEELAAMPDEEFFSLPAQPEKAQVKRRLIA